MLIDLMQINRTMRISIEKVLQHPFFKGEMKGVNNYETVKIGEVYFNYANFTIDEWIGEFYSIGIN